MFAGAINVAGVVGVESEVAMVNEVAKVVPVVVAPIGSTGESTLVDIDMAGEVDVASAEVASPVTVARGSPRHSG